MVISALAFVVSFRSFNEKGFLFNNAYIYASKKERETMDKKPHYRQTAVVFLLIGVIFLINGIAVITGYEWMYSVVVAVALVTGVYAVVSSVKTGKNKRK